PSGHRRRDAGNERTRGGGGRHRAPAGDEGALHIRVRRQLHRPPGHPGQRGALPPETVRPQRVGSEGTRGARRTSGGSRERLTFLETDTNGCCGSEQIQRIAPRETNINRASFFGGGHSKHPSTSTYFAG